MNGLKRIEKIYAWICTDMGDDTEGIPAIAGPNGQPIPMVVARLDLVEKMRPAAEQMKAMGHKMALVEFASRITLEELQ